MGGSVALMGSNTWAERYSPLVRIPSSSRTARHIPYLPTVGYNGEMYSKLDNLSENKGNYLKPNGLVIQHVGTTRRKHKFA